ncbi:MAG: hypothetical protein Q7O66_20105, partial [Dehalococcoidia bacterium]|nr:hypothetical protein [Dehalococcoidia bacterium]
PKNQVMASFGDRARLIGYDLPANAAGGLPVRVSPKVNSKLGVTLYWEGSKSMKEDYSVLVQLLDSSGKLASQVDGQPAGGAFPTSFWDDGDLVTDFHELPLPNTLAAGQCKRVAGLYILRTGERLRTEAGADSIELGTITVE